MQLLCFVSLPPPISTYLSHLDSLRPPQSHNPHLHLLSGARVRPPPSLLFPSLTLYGLPRSLTCKSTGRIRPSILSHSPFPNHSRLTPTPTLADPGPGKASPLHKASPGLEAADGISKRISFAECTAHGMMARLATYRHSVFNIQYPVFGIRYSMPNGRPTTCTLETPGAHCEHASKRAFPVPQVISVHADKRFRRAILDSGSLILDS
ncbi:hypothetical protein K466DRAFT_315737 [Polyporus arcularius HHB13444]|uniref:Uncharacterized protein n=1 Tax=Polyporus arcularius HHB13444 TaxID=1314778 RepID=A0A5C3NXC9_9APHY|nr:hypothetical protein K466DRAFT_315737 [Polyporus arcularius HHB13444]